MRRTQATRSAWCAAGKLTLAMTTVLTMATVLTVTAVLPAEPAAAEPAPAGAAAPQLMPRLAAPNAPHRARPTQSAAAEARWTTQNALLPTARELARQATVGGSDIAGVRIDLATGVVHVYRTEPARASRLPAGLSGAAAVSSHPARYTRAAMLDAMATIAKDSDALVDGGVTVQSVGPTVDGTGVTVVVAAAPGSAGLTRAANVLRARYGGIVGTVTGVAHVTTEADQYYFGPRFNDGAPWSGGDRILSGAGGCTTGFAATLGTQPVMLTAAHCGGAGTDFFNGPNATGGYPYLGTSTQSNSDTDINAIAVDDSWPFVNVGAADGGYQILILGWGTPIVGETVCQSGSYTGEVCQLQVVDTGVRWCLRRNIFGKCKQWAGPFADAVNLAGSGSYAAGHGDSGGPVYEMGAPSAGAGNAVGLVHGQLTGNAAGAYPDYVTDTLVCPAPEGPMARCSSGFSFAHMPGY